ncbi:Clp protease N-terminal domain-containing protein [Phycicoccus avicenniae]|uniref:Clp protease N-terminal domain-containing protein n=1 Tax=Phycicoccus avicenniae TaxID=2828860 RepID=UPI003D2BD336
MNGRWGASIGLSQTAWRECALLGHREVDVEHVFLATLHDPVVGRALRERGVTLEGTRGAVDAVVRAEVERLGISVPVAPSQPRPPLADLHHGAVGDLTFAQRAMEALVPGDALPAVLLRLVDEPGGTVRALITHQGADPDAVREAVVTLDVPVARGTDEVDPSTLPGVELLVGSPGQAVRRVVVLESPVEAVWRRCSTAAGSTGWLGVAGERVVSEVEARTVPDPGRRRLPWREATLVRRLVLARPPQGDEPGLVVWSVSREQARWGRTGLTQWSHVSIGAEADGATRVELVRGGLLARRTGRPARRLVLGLLRVGARASTDALTVLAGEDEEPLRP